MIVFLACSYYCNAVEFPLWLENEIWSLSKKVDFLETENMDVICGFWSSPFVYFFSKLIHCFCFNWHEIFGSIHVRSTKPNALSFRFAYHHSLLAFNFFIWTKTAMRLGHAALWLSVSLSVLGREFGTWPSDPSLGGSSLGIYLGLRVHFICLDVGYDLIFHLCATVCLSLTNDDSWLNGRSTNSFPTSPEFETCALHFPILSLISFSTFNFFRSS